MTDHETVIAPDGSKWRLKQILRDGKPVTGECSWSACTGGAGHSHQWKFGATREQVLARLQSEASAS